MTKQCPLCGQNIAQLHKINDRIQVFITTVDEGVIQSVMTSQSFENGHYFCPKCDGDLFTTEQEVIDFFSS